MEFQLQYQPIDIAIIVLYFIVTIALGLWVSKHASKNIESYFLGGNVLPWWVLGVSNASGMFDITGTMWLVYIAFVYGLKSAWLPWLWPIFNQIVLMIFLSAWLRRSNVMTGAEWITTRFGRGLGSDLSYISVVFFALISVVTFLAYEFQGIGKFAAAFLPWDLSPNWHAIIIMGVTTIYVIKGGMFSVVLTELLQFVVMTICSIAVGIIAIYKVSPETIQKMTPDGWSNLFFGWRLDLDWSQILASANTKIAEDGYSLFGFFFAMMLIKGVLVSSAGPAPNYDMQRILATKNPREASLMSGFVSLVLFIPRYMMVAGMAVLALAYFMPELQAMGNKPDFEMILPFVLRNFVPAGLLGLLMAGLLAAFMSTYAATVNAAPAYLVNDVYKRYINPNAHPKKYVRMSYVVSALVVVVGIVFGYWMTSINAVMMIIVNALYSGYAASNILKWYWWRFNAYGFFWGMASGMVAALAAPPIMAAYFPGVNSIYGFPPIFLISLIGCILGSLLTPPTEEEVLKNFYKTVRPWGFWEPVYQKVKQDDPSFERNKNFARDWFNVGIGIVWQMALLVFPMYLVIRDMQGVIYSAIVILVTGFILKINWYDRLEDEPQVAASSTPEVAMETALVYEARSEK